MECHKTNSSLDSILILDCEEEIKSVQSSLDTNILNNNERKPKKHHRHYKSKSEHRCRRNKCYDSRRAVVTQEIHVERQDFQSVLNLDTTVCKHENRHHRSCDGKTSKDPKYKYKRTVPCCLRQLCHESKNRRTQFRHSKECRPADTHNKARHTRMNNVHGYKKESNHGIRRSRHSSHEKKPMKEKVILKLDEPQTIPKNQFKLDYEDISTTSLDSYLDIPTSYKHIANKDIGREYQESKLDTLIKRTKERERRLVEQSRKFPWYTSTPAYSGVSSMDCPRSCSEVGLSLHSRSTLVLEPRDHGNSPFIEGRQSPTLDKYWQCSPSSHIEDTNLSSKSLMLKLKPEPTMDIEVYSLTQSSDNNMLELKEQLIKKEIKSEPALWKHDT